MEDILNDLMFDVPSDDTITEVIINKDVVDKTSEPVISRAKAKKRSRLNFKNSKVITAEEVS